MSSKAAGNISPENILISPKTSPISLQQSEKAGHILIDVRSSKEFAEGSILNAVSIPLFDDTERSIIGTIYKHGSKEAAIEQGFAFVKEKFPQLIEQFEPYRDKTLTIYCAKGGMRSKSIVNLLHMLGITVYQLEGGYRRYRHQTLEKLDQFRGKLIVLHGMTGTGKTRIIEKLNDAIDLEGIAQHRSSLFGGINLVPRTQKQFEALLAKRLDQLEKPPYFIEGESNKLGQVFLPKAIIEEMALGTMIWIKASIETRIQRIIEDYPITSDEIRQKMEQIFRTLTKRLGHATVEKLCYLLRTDKIDELVYILLTEYYDKRYGNMFKKYDFRLEVSSENIDDAVKELTEYRASLLNT